MLLLLSSLLHFLQPLLGPLCFISAWIFVFLLLGTVWGSMKDISHRTQEMHQIPCASCQFFTNNYRLKCTVHPTIANTEEAVNCQDYTANRY